MKRFPVPVLTLSLTFAFVTAALFTGCDSLSNVADHVRDKLDARDEAQVRDYAAPPRDVYEAVRVTADRLGFRFLHGGPAQGVFEAMTGVGQGDVPNSARQISLKIKIHEAGDGSEVTIVLKEILEANTRDHTGSATETPLRDTPLYDSVLRGIQKVLDEKKTGLSSK